MPSPLYLDTARFGSILPECAEMLREFASLLESEGQFPLFDEFLLHGSGSWPDRLTSRFPMLARWQGIPSLRQQVLTLCGITTPATVLFASASRHLARVAFQMLSHRCERILCSDADWPEFQDMLRKQMVQSGGSLHTVKLEDPLFPDEDPYSREYRLAKAYRNQGCDGALITAVSAEGLTTRVERFSDAISHAAHPAYLVIDGSQQAGHLPIELSPRFKGIYLAGTHKWLRSGVPLSFGVIVHDGESSDANLQIRKAIRLSQVDDSLLLQTADVGLKNPRQTTRLEPLVAASLAIEYALENRVQDMLEIRQRNARHLFEIVTNLQLELSVSVHHGIVELMLDGTDFTAHEIQRQFADEGLTLSVCGERRLRISCSATEFTESEISRLWRIFGRLADRYCAIHDAASDSDGCHSVA